MKNLMYQKKKIVCSIIICSICIIWSFLKTPCMADESSPTCELSVSKIKYLEKENLFRVQDNEELAPYYFIDLAGNLVENPQFESQYLEYVYYENGGREQNGMGNFITNIFGDVIDPSKYLENPQHQYLVGGLSFDGNDWIWISETHPTINGTNIVLKAIDYNTNEEIYNIDCTEYYVSGNYPTEIRGYYSFEDERFVIFNSDRAFSDRETGESLGSPGLVIDLNTGEIRTDVMRAPNIEDTIDASGYRSAFSLWGLSSTGYHAIVDVYGRVIINCDDYSMLIGKLSEGVFFNKNDCCFYDLDLNKVIDLSSYPLVTEEFDKFYFKDGYCELHATSNDGIDFYGLIDKNGEFIIDWTEEKGTYVFKYIEKLNDETLYIKLNSHNFAFDLETSEMTELPETFTQVGEKLYYTEEGELYCYNLETKDVNVVEINCSNIQKQSLEAIKEMLSRYMEERSYVFTIDSYSEMDGYYLFDIYSDSEDSYEFGTVCINPYTCTGTYVPFEGSRETWTLM